MRIAQYKGAGGTKPPTPEIKRVNFIDETDIRPGQEGLLGKDQVFLNGFFEPVKEQDQINYHFIKRPGLSPYLTVGPTGPGRGCLRWKQTGKLYSVNNNKILSNQTDLGVTLSTTSGFVDFAETRPGAVTQYLGVNDGSALYLIASDDSVIVLNNVAITSSSVANPTHITAPSHGLNSGNKIIIRNHTGSTPNINDTIFVVTVLDSNHFTIPVNVTVGGSGGTIGVFPATNTGDLHYMDTYWFTLKDDGSVWNCAADDPTTWPTTSFIYAQMVPGHGIGLAKQDNYLVVFSDRHVQMFYNNANPSGSPLSNVEEAMHQLGCVSPNAIASQEDTVYWIANTQTGGYTIYKLVGTTNLEDIGTPTLNRSLQSNFFLSPGSPSAVKIVLTSGTTWTVPADFNKHNNTVEAIGGGAGGAGGTAGGNSGVGGGGAAYSKIINFDPGGAGSISYAIGAAGTGGAIASPGTSGTDTTFNTSSIVAKGGNASGAGGTAAASTGTIKHSGGNGGAVSAYPGSPVFASSGGGGGGAGGPSADGANGQNGTNVFAGTSNGGQGDPTAGGLGGVGGAVGGGGAGSNGNAGAEITTNVGSGGGGGGGGSIRSFSLPAGGSHGGNGGLYGAGGGGGGEDTAFGAAGGNGSQGVIVITYVPTTTASDSTAANGYILRIAGHVFYIINLINTKETWAYDQTYKIWSKWQSTTANIWPVVNTQQYAPVGLPQVLVGQDPTTGTIWQVDMSIGQDNGVSFEVRAQTVPLTFGSMKRKFYDQVELIGDRQSSTSVVSISYTDDDYVTISTPRQVDTSQIRYFSRAWGNSRRRAWIVSYTSSIPLRIQGLEFTYTEGST